MERDSEYLLDIVEAARLAVSYVAGVSREEFLGDVQRQDAVIRRLLIIGEAARRVSEASRATWPAIPWRLMAAMRNRLVHEYDDVDLTIVWETVVSSLPELIQTVEASSQDPGSGSK
jgi:uncharacterized protein with HEPN domain